LPPFQKVHNLSYHPTTNLLDAIQDALRAHQWMLQAWQQ
jgi:hypothetical protein